MLKVNFKVMLIVAIAIIAMVFAINAWSQSFSGRGVDQSEMGQVACVSEIERLETILITLKQNKQAHLDCNEQGQVYDGDGCVDVQPLRAAWDDLEMPTELRFNNIHGDPVGETVSVSPRGRDGQPGECPTGYVDVEQ